MTSTAGARLSLAAEPRFFPGAGIPSRLLGLGLRVAVRPVFSAWAHLPVEVFPPNLLEHAARLLPVDEGTSWRSIDLPGCGGEWIRAKGVEDLHDGHAKAILYFHGGAFFTCGLNTHRNLVSRISAASGQPVLNVGYRQMPHEPIAESVADGVDALRWLLEQGYRTEDITLAGDSAGGYLAFSVARAALDLGLGRPAGVVALSPLLDFDSSAKRAHRNAHRCQTFPLAALDKFARMTEQMDTRRGISGRRVCPVNMPLADMPPALIQVGSREILVADAEVMANRLVSAGVPCELQLWDRQVHVFQAASAWVPEARRAIEEVGAFVERVAIAEPAPVAEPAAPVRERTRSRGRRVAAATV